MKRKIIPKSKKAVNYLEDDENSVYNAVADNEALKAISEELRAKDSDYSDWNDIPKVKYRKYSKCRDRYVLDAEAYTMRMLGDGNGDMLGY